jgi:hypothetical protein
MNRGLLCLPFSASGGMTEISDLFLPVFLKKPVSY